MCQSKQTRHICSKDLIISSMTVSDLEEIQQDLEKKFDNFWNFQIFKEELVNTNSSYLVARLPLTIEEKKTSDTDVTINNLKNLSPIVGFAGIKKILDEATIMNIVVKKEHRNQGIAFQLLQQLILLSLQLGCQTITLEVNETNLSAIHLYEKFGFEKKGFRKNYYKGTQHAIIMTKQLNGGMGPDPVPPSEGETNEEKK